MAFRSRCSPNPIQILVIFRTISSLCAPFGLRCSTREMSFAQELRRRLRCGDPSLDGVFVNPKYIFLGDEKGEPFEQALFNNTVVRSIRLPKTPESDSYFIATSFDFYEKPAQKCNWSSIETLIWHLATNHRREGSGYWDNMVLQVHCLSIGKGGHDSTVTKLCLSLVKDYARFDENLPPLRLNEWFGKTKEANMISIKRIDLKLAQFASAQGSFDFLSGLAADQKMKYMYLTHGAKQRDLWPGIVLHVLDHATLEYIQVFEQGSARDYTLDVTLQSVETQSSKRLRIEGTRDIDCAFAIILSRLLGHVVVDDMILRTMRPSALGPPSSMFACLECATTRISRLNLSGFCMDKDTWISLRQALAPRRDR
jgi:hypothetical protein